MTEITQIILTVKRHLKAQARTYRDVAVALDMTEAGVKRLFASKRLTLERLAQLAEYLGFTMAELMAEAANSTPQLARLTHAQESQLVADESLLLVSVFALNHWTADQISATYALSRAEIFERLMVLDRMDLLNVLPGDRIRLRVRRDFDWLPDGPIRAYFLRQGLPDFLSGRFNQPEHALEFSHGMLAAPAFAQLQVELRKLKIKFANLHEESASMQLGQKVGVGLLFALREWEPLAFQHLRRK